MFDWGNRSLADVRETLEIYQRRMRDRLAAGKPLYLEIDSHLGWRLQPSCRHPNWPYTTDALGNRRSSLQSGTISGSAYQMAIAGNSYVHCDDAANDETWVWKLQERFGSDYQIHNLGVTVVDRPDALAGDSVKTELVVHHLLERVGQMRVQSPDNFVLLQSTFPLRTGLHLREAFELFVGRGSVISVCVPQKHPMKSFRMLSGASWSHFLMRRR